jgi:hypothetical protein
MKNKFNSTIKAIIILAFVVFCFVSCDSTPVVGGDKPFIVNEISDIGGGMSEYYGGYEASYDRNGFSGRPSIVLPSRLYNIGDTVHICR